MQFTKDDLYEIEKRFDIHAGSIAHAAAEIISRLAVMGKDNELSNKIFEESIETFDLYITISAKARKMREKQEK